MKKKIPQTDVEELKFISKVKPPVTKKRQHKTPKQLLDEALEELVRYNEGERE